MIEHTEITAFLELMQNRPVIDVRSPSEYAKGHIPKAFNIPLFDDRERARVGTVYHCEGREKAVALGILIAKPKMEAIAEAVNQVGCKRVLLHCWRGGMRSEGVAQLLHDSGMQVQVLTGGYKSFRKAVLDEFVKKRKLLVLGGMTGSGKTEVLHSLKARGEQVLDMEAMANHK
ncbi:MAG: rhodanese-like domain-containing protein, partial [Flavobacteriales bacterium]